MQINPGGRLDIEDVIGRDHEIDRYWRVLERQGLVLSAERRIGKTHVLLKMSEECRQRAGGQDTAIQLLDHLRALRLTQASRIRFLFTGSIGLHLVLRSLREAGNANDPVNDMMSLTVPPMADAHTTHLAAALLAETLAEPPDIPDLAARIVDQVGGFPYYVHHVVDQLDQLRRPPTLGDVSTTVEGLINDPHDPANLKYYVNRLSQYYTDSQRSLALLVLDMIARQPAPIPIPTLLNLCKHQKQSPDDEQFRDILALLAEDHYIEPATSSGPASYDFRWQLVKRWWAIARP